MFGALNQYLFCIDYVGEDEDIVLILYLINLNYNPVLLPCLLSVSIMWFVMNNIVITNMLD